MDTLNWSSFFFPPLFVVVAVLIKDKYVSGMAFNDSLLLTDIGLNVVAYLLSDVIVQFGINRMFKNSPDSSLLESGTDIILQPLLHGLLVGTTRPMISNSVTLNANSINFMNSFIDGTIYNIVGKYMSTPLVIYFTK